MALLIATFRKASLALARGDELGRFRLGFLITVLVYNWTEAGFRGLDPVWFVFFIIAMTYPPSGSESLASMTGVASDAEEDKNRRLRRESLAGVLQSIEIPCLASLMLKLCYDQGYE